MVQILACKFLKLHQAVLKAKLWLTYNCSTLSSTSTQVNMARPRSSLLTLSDNKVKVAQEWRRIFITEGNIMQLSKNRWSIPRGPRKLHNWNWQKVCLVRWLPLYQYHVWCTNVPLPHVISHSVCCSVHVYMVYLYNANTTLQTVRTYTSLQTLRPHFCTDAR